MILLIERTNTYDIYDGRVWQRDIPPSALPTVLRAYGIDAQTVDDVEPLHPDTLRVLAALAYALDDHVAAGEAGRWIDAHLRPAQRPLKRSAYSLKHEAVLRHIAESAFVELLEQKGLYRNGKIFARLV